ncbi:urease accessory protein UreE [Propylenella binzhouense]|uniref:Urease accessory protein UreE n=1 Tax=Propylenella binzhouense TaxID=2555902 RepID=A0A964WV83_9HYPH|nr:urease accessory protein UreE [Propylenella binzhouense]
MIRAAIVRPAGAWSEAPADRVTLSYDDRHRRRIAMRGDGGLAFLLDLPEALSLRDGDGLVLEDGRIVAVRAKPEALLEIRARDAHHLARLAWHIGNRHVPAAIGAGRILIRPDHVIAEMLEGLGAELAAAEAPFDPEGGAYAEARHEAGGHAGHRHGAGDHHHAAGEPHHHAHGDRHPHSHERS